MGPFSPRLPSKINFGWGGTLLLTLTSAFFHLETFFPFSSGKTRSEGLFFLFLDKSPGGGGRRKREEKVTFFPSPLFSPDTFLFPLSPTFFSWHLHTKKLTTATMIKNFPFSHTKKNLSHVREERRRISLSLSSPFLRFQQTDLLRRFLLFPPLSSSFGETA